MQVCAVEIVIAEVEERMPDVVEGCVVCAAQMCRDFCGCPECPDHLCCLDRGFSQEA